MERLPVAERRHQLIGAALAVASVEGLEGTTVRAIASRAGVSLGVVHYCFSDKAALVAALSREVAAGHDAPISRIPVSVRDVQASLDVAIEAFLDDLRDDRGTQILGYELVLASLRDAHLRSGARNHLSIARRAARRFLEDVARAAEVEWASPVEALAAGVVAVAEGHALVWLVDGDDDALRAGLRWFTSYLVSQARPQVGAA